MTDLSGRFEGELHVFPVRVYYEDTDAGGIVYHATYLRFAERARTEMMRLLGVPHARMVEGDGVAFAVRHCDIDYPSPARLDDRLEVRSRIENIGGATLDLAQVIRRTAEDRDGTDLARIRVRLACINRSGRPVRLPASVRSAVDNHLQRHRRD